MVRTALRIVLALLLVSVIQQVSAVSLGTATSTITEGAGSDTPVIAFVFTNGSTISGTVSVTISSSSTATEGLDYVLAQRIGTTADINDHTYFTSGSILTVPPAGTALYLVVGQVTNWDYDDDETPGPSVTARVTNNFDDNIAEGVETVTVTMVDLATNVSSSQTISILDNEPTVELDVVPFQDGTATIDAKEGSSNSTLRVRLLSTPTQDIVVPLAITGSARQDWDNAYETSLAPVTNYVDDYSLDGNGDGIAFEAGGADTIVYPTNKNHILTGALISAVTSATVDGLVTGYTELTIPQASTVPFGVGVASGDDVAVLVTDDRYVEDYETIRFQWRSSSTTLPVFMRVLDNEPVMSFGTSTDAKEGAPGTTGAFSLSFDAANASELYIPYTLLGTALSSGANQDYTFSPPAGVTVSAAMDGIDDYLVVSISATPLTMSFSVVPNNDTVHEGVETAVLSLNDAISSVVLIEDDELPTGGFADINIKAIQPKVREDSGGYALLKFVREDTSAGSLAVRFSVVMFGSGNAEERVDYSLLDKDGGLIRGAVLFPQGESEVEVRVVPIPDRTVEGAEKVVLSVDPSENGFYRQGNQSVNQVTIQDDEVTFTVYGYDIKAEETARSALDGNGNAILDPKMHFRIKRDSNAAPTNMPLRVQMTGTATMMQDGGDDCFVMYAIEGNNEWVLLTTVNGWWSEGNTLNVTLPSNASYLDIVVVGANIEGVNINEDDFRFAQETDVLSISTLGDYTIVIDEDAEGAETVEVTLTESDDFIRGNDTVTGFIADDDIFVSIRKGADAGEPSFSGYFDVRFDRAAPQDIKIPFTVDESSGQSATPGLATDTPKPDYIRLPEFIVMPAGSTQANILVDPVSDGVDNEPFESVHVVLTSSNDYILSSLSDEYVNVIDLIGTVSVTTSPTPAEIKERSTSSVDFTFTIDRNSTRTEAVEVLFKVGGTGTKEVDFLVSEDLTKETDGKWYGKVTIPAVTVAGTSSSATVSITVPKNEVSLIEGDETASLTIQAGAGYEVDVDNSTGAATILDDEPKVSIVTQSNSNKLSGVKGRMLVTYSGGAEDLTDLPITLQISSASTAKLGEDYSIDIEDLAFSSSIKQILIEVTPLNKSTTPGSKNVIIEVIGNTTYSAEETASSATVEILDGEGTTASFVSEQNDMVVRFGANPPVNTEVMTVDVLLETVIARNVADFDVSLSNLSSDTDLPNWITIGSATATADSKVMKFTVTVDPNNTKGLAAALDPAPENGKNYRLGILVKVNTDPTKDVYFDDESYLQEILIIVLEVL